MRHIQVNPLKRTRSPVAGKVEALMALATDSGHITGHPEVGAVHLGEDKSCLTA